MISDRLIKTDIPLIDLIYGDMKNLMYETEQDLYALPAGTSEDSAEYREIAARLDAYVYVYTEIDRAMYERAKIPAEQLEKTY